MTTLFETKFQECMRSLEEKKKKGAPWAAEVAEGFVDLKKKLKVPHESTFRAHFDGDAAKLAKAMVDKLGYDDAIKAATARFNVNPKINEFFGLAKEEIKSLKPKELKEDVLPPASPAQIAGEPSSAFAMDGKEIDKGIRIIRSPRMAEFYGNPEWNISEYSKNPAQVTAMFDSLTRKQRATCFFVWKSGNTHGEPDLCITVGPQRFRCVDAQGNTLSKRDCSQMIGADKLEKILKTSENLYRNIEIEEIPQVQISQF